MSYRNSPAWMWAEALDLLQKAERLQRQFFSLKNAESRAVWEPPVDVTESASEVDVVAALPGIHPERLRLRFEGHELVIEAFRPLPVFAAHDAGHRTIHRLEIPYGRFERRVALPPGRYELVEQAVHHGCLHLRLRKHP